MIKKALLAAGASVVAFAIGLIGAFFLLPMMAPDFTERLLSEAADSTEVTTDSLTLADDDSTQRHARALLDSLANDSTATLDSTIAAALAPGMVTIPQDSLDALRADLRTQMRKAEDIQQQLTRTRNELADATARKEDMKDLSATLTRIDDRQLAPILQELDMASLEVLYAESTGRNRTRLLQAMPAERAARFINERVRADGSAPGTAN